jgi:hypothetical protein
MSWWRHLFRFDGVAKFEELRMRYARRLLIGTLILYSALAWGQSTNIIQLIPTQNNSDVGKIRFRELTTNGQNYLELVGPNAIGGNKRVSLPDNASPYTLVGLQIPDQTFTERVIFGRAGNGVELARFQRNGSARFLTIYETIAPDNFMTINATGPLTFDSDIEIRFARSGASVWTFADDVLGVGRYMVGTYTPGAFPFATNEGKFQIYTSEPNTIGLTVMGASGQVGELTRIRKFDNTSIFGVRGNGRVTVGNCSGSLQTMTICPDTTTGAGLAVRSSITDFSIIQSWTDTSGNPKVWVGSRGEMNWVGQIPEPLTNPNAGGIRYDLLTQKLQYYENGGAWAPLVSSGASLPVIDTTAIVFDNGDGTKRIRLEAGLISPGTTRALTAQDADYVVAGENITNVFTANQILNGVSLLPQTTNQGNIGTVLQRFSGAAFHAGVDIRNADIGPGVGTGYLAANKVEIHRGTTGEFWDFIHTQPNYLTLRNASGLVLMSWDTSLANYYVGTRGTFFPLVDNLYSLGTGSFRWKDLHLTGTINGATNVVYTTGNQDIGGNKTFTSDTYLGNAITLGCNSGNGTCSIGVSGSRPSVNAHYLGVNGSLFIASGNDNSIVFGTSSTVYVGATPVYDGTTTCGSGEAIKAMTVSKGLIISLTCGAP